MAALCCIGGEGEGWGGWLGNHEPRGFLVKLKAEREGGAYPSEKGGRWSPDPGVNP